MNVHASMVGTGNLTLLEQWALNCNEVSLAKLPRAILEVCQIIGDELPCSDLADQVTRKRKVFERIAIGDNIGAIRAMVPEDCEVEMLGKRGGSFAIIKTATGNDARSAGPTRETALLGAVIQLAIRQTGGGGLPMFANQVPSETN